MIKCILPNFSVVDGFFFQNFDDFGEKGLVLKKIEHAAVSEIFLAVIEILVLEEI